MKKAFVFFGILLGLLFILLGTFNSQREENLTDDIREAYLLVECPRQLFPFARRIIYDLHSDGSLPPLLLDPVNFADLYQKKKSVN